MKCVIVARNVRDLELVDSALKTLSVLRQGAYRREIELYVLDPRDGGQTVHGWSLRVLAPKAARRGASLRSRVARKAARVVAGAVPGRLSGLLGLRLGGIYAKRLRRKPAERPRYISLTPAADWPTWWARGMRAAINVVGSRQGYTEVRLIAEDVAQRRYRYLWKQMREGSRKPASVVTSEDWLQILDAVERGLTVDLGDYVSDAIWLLSHAGPASASRLMDAAARSGAASGPEYEHRAVEILIAAASSGAPESDTRSVARRLSMAADEAFETGNLAVAARRFTLALRLLFDPNLHVGSLSSPLLDDTSAWLEPIVDSRVLAAIRSGDRLNPVVNDGTAHSDVVVVPGSYPRFAEPVIQALEQGWMAPTVVDPASRHRLLHGTGLNEELVGMLLGASDVPDNWEWMSQVANAGTVFIDWADRALPFVLRAVSPAARVVLRVHSVDVLSGWIHLAPLSRVDEIVVVSEPMADLVRQVTRTSGSIRTIPNIVNSGNYSGG